jgi:hypothetical protein
MTPKPGTVTVFKCGDRVAAFADGMGTATCLGVGTVTGTDYCDTQRVRIELDDHGGTSGIRRG